MEYLVTPEQTLSAAYRAGLDSGSLNFSGIAVVTFSGGVVEWLSKACELSDFPWISSRDHPYAAARLVRRGKFRGLGITVIVPPMGASPLACIVEDLVACGVGAVFLVCAGWSLGAPVRFGDLIVPSFSLGCGGTSIHYGHTGGRVHPAPPVVDALIAASQAHGARAHVGGNGTCEALYRITPQMVDEHRRQGCLCMENGEASTLFAIGRSLGVLTGALLQPYIDLGQGWDPARLADRRYRATCRLQAEVVLEASVDLKEQRLI